MTLRTTSHREPGTSEGARPILPLGSALPIATRPFVVGLPESAPLADLGLNAMGGRSAHIPKIARDGTSEGARGSELRVRAAGR